MRSGWALAVAMCWGCGGAAGSTASSNDVVDAGGLPAHTSSDANLKDGGLGPIADAGDHVDTDDAADAAAPADALNDDASTEAGGEPNDSSTTRSGIHCFGADSVTHTACNGYGLTSSDEYMFFLPAGQTMYAECTSEMPTTTFTCPTGNACDYVYFDSTTKTTVNDRGYCVN
jgi:hypothetical protein